LHNYSFYIQKKEFIMTSLEKRQALDHFCDNHSCHDGCPLFADEFQCGRGYYFTTGYGNAGYMTDDEINAAYAAAFPESNPAPLIKDSGERRQFDTGAVRDIQEGKGRMDLLPWAAVMEISKHCEAGALKYGEHNVDKGIPTHSLCDSAARHLAKYLDGWKDEPHLLAAAWNLLWAVQMELKHPELVDTPWKHKTEEEN
jgi:hypothetical protein